MTYLTLLQSFTKINIFKYYIAKFVYPILIILGLLGNSLSLLAIIKIKQRKTKANRNFSNCLVILCLIDICLLFFGCLREYLEVVFSLPLRSYSVYTCKISLYVCYFFSSYSSYLYAFIAYERWTAIKNPIKYKQKNEAKTNKKSIAMICAACVLICVPILFCVKLQKYFKSKTLAFMPKTKCIILPQFYTIITMLDAFVYSFLPFLMTLVFSLATLVYLVKKKRNNNLTMALNQSKPSSNQSKTEQILLANLFKEKNKIPSLKIKRVSNFKATIMLLTLPFSYLIATFPYFVILFLAFLASFSKNLNEKYYEKSIPQLKH